MEIKKIVVSKKTFEFMKSTAFTFYELYSCWHRHDIEELDEALDELHKVSALYDLTDIFDLLTRGEAKLIPKQTKIYKVTLGEKALNNLPAWVKTLAEEVK